MEFQILIRLKDAIPNLFKRDGTGTLIDLKRFSVNKQDPGKAKGQKRLPLLQPKCPFVGV